MFFYWHVLIIVKGLSLKMDKPQIIAHVQKSMNYTLFDCRWVPCSAKFVVLGNHARGTGALQIYEMSHGDINLIHEVNTALEHRTSY